MDNPKTILISISSQSYKPLSDITYPLWERYCEQLGYDWRSSSVSEPKDIPWLKIDAMRSRLAEGYGVVMWVGADTLPTRMDWRATLPEHCGISICYDLYGINADVILVNKNAGKLLYAVATMGHSLYRDHLWAEQEALIRLSQHQEYKNLFYYESQSQMNAYLNQEYDRPVEWAGQWNLNSNILHLPGLPLTRRIELAREYARYCER